MPCRLTLLKFKKQGAIIESICYRASDWLYSANRKGAMGNGPNKKIYPIRNSVDMRYTAKETTLNLERSAL